MISLKTEEEIKKIKKACAAASGILKELELAVKPGMTTTQLDKLAHSLAAKKKVKLAFKGYRGFPGGICVSVNDEVVHGIPGPRIIKKGDIVSIDIGIINEGYYGDTALSLGVGEISRIARKLLSVTEASLYKGIEAAKAGNRLSDISYAVQSWVEAHGFSVVRDLVGHGIGKHLHEDPQIPNFGPSGKGPRLKDGMTLAIEPMVSEGHWEVGVARNGWTVTTRDHSLSAHFEHTILISSKGTQILTAI